METVKTEPTVEEELQRALDQNARLVAEIANLKTSVELEKTRADMFGRNLIDHKETLVKLAGGMPELEHEVALLKADIEMTKMLMEVGR